LTETNNTLNTENNKLTEKNETLTLQTYNVETANKNLEQLLNDCYIKLDELQEINTKLKQKIEDYDDTQSYNSEDIPPLEELDVESN
jgi:DNA polymerase/3'-5' exonuclease PolX